MRSKMIRCFDRVTCLVQKPPLWDLCSCNLTKLVQSESKDSDFLFSPFGTFEVSSSFTKLLNRIRTSHGWFSTTSQFAKSRAFCWGWCHFNSTIYYHFHFWRLFIIPITSEVSNRSQTCGDVSLGAEFSVKFVELVHSIALLLHGRVAQANLHLSNCRILLLHVKCQRLVLVSWW